ncbi:hypothetical protein E4U55_001453 [Claviceps digitariae]|nr:hypothetical protein E4U55_001453 [Claviceps digitariae]
MDPHGSSAISDSDSSAGGSSRSQPPAIVASSTFTSASPYTSESSTRPGPGPFFNRHPSSTFARNLHPYRSTNFPAAGAAAAAPCGKSDEMDQAANAVASDNGWRAGSSLPSFSRGFDLFMSSRDAGHGSSAIEDGFFIPSYLSTSTYARKLTKAHEAKLQARADLKLQSPKIGTTSNGAGFHHQPPMPAGSHRGISHSVVERPPPPPPEENGALPPLPAQWNKDDMWGGIEIHPDGRSVEYIGSRSLHERDQEASAVRADHYIPPQCGIYYYEVSIVYGKRDDTTIAVGFSTKNASISRPLGWEPDSVAYHGDDGRCFTGQNTGQMYGPEFNTGDVIGCGINFLDHTAFFTRNGVNLGTASHDVTRGKLYPAVSLKKPRERVTVNFGQSPFVFDIDIMMNEQKKKIIAEIQKTDISRLEPGLGETDLIQALVLQFLQHDGYVETARAFAEDIRQQKEALNLDPNVTVDGINIKDDEDANNRQRIRRAILDGEIDRALKLTCAYYPQVFRDNEEVHFRLRCRKFIELVRMAAQLRADEDPKRSNGKIASAGGASQAMDVDDNGGADVMAWNEKMDTEVIEEEETHSDMMMQLEQEMLDYGQKLGAQYARDARPDFSKALAEIWALVAYANPLEEPKVSHLLDRKGRVTVAEELNSAILASLGKSSHASLEKLYAQTCVLLEDIGRDGGSGAFVAVQDVVEAAWDSAAASSS